MNMHLNKSIRRILLAGAAAAYTVGVLAAVGPQNPPPGSGQVPDYFGVTGNYANSPQPVLTSVTVIDPGGTIATGCTGGTGGGNAALVATTYDYANWVQTPGVADVQVLSGGTGYTECTTVTVSGGVGVIPVTVTPEITNGVITGIAEFDPLNALWIGNNVPPTPTTYIGTGFTVPLANTGIQKFVNALPGIPGVSSYVTPGANGYDASGANTLRQSLPAAVPDTTTFPATATLPASDYYEIAEVAYTKQLHRDLPATHLRGYVQIKTGGFTLAGYSAAPDKLAYANQYANYLGPVIVATKGKPVRIKLVNLLPTGAAGNLPFPVDHTYMGAEGNADTDNRTALHLHGGNTPWISDGTPRQWVKPVGEAGPNKGVSAANVPDMWFDSSGNVIASCAGQLACATAGATNNPGNGALTFFYTNEQSARLMFYHDHAMGITRLNVYAGLAAGYVLQDPTEQTLVTNGNLPGLPDTIPLVIQEKTFVPDNIRPVLNFYGPFASQLNSQDPTWRWTSGATATADKGNGDVWVPHVYMPNQNPGDISGANSVGRWDYGPWFWPPFTGIVNPPILNPYYDPACISSTTQYCEGRYIPGVPNGAINVNLAGSPLNQPSGTPEAFNDTPLVNGTAYPVLKVDPKQYRLRILSVGNDRMLNLSLVLAASKQSVDTTANGNAGAANNAVPCDGTTTYPASYPAPLVGNVPAPVDCTEVKMVPFTSNQNSTPGKAFPSWWYTQQKGGATFDGRPSGVFDPATRGPAMVQIGTEGGFLSSPAVIKPQPVNFEYNPKNIVIGNIKEHALLLGNAERADVLVDFTHFAGSTLILYNDAPAPVPAFDLRLDYYTGNYDNTDTGGTFSTIPGYGPNSRTLMQIQVSGTGGTHPVDDIGTINLATLTTAVQNAFKTSQEPIVVPQVAYNATYGTSVADSSLATAPNHDLSLISDNALDFTPLNPALNGSVSTKLTLDMQPKSIIEDFTSDYGRMNALLGVEIPKTTATVQTSIPQAYIDPPTELVRITPNDGTPISPSFAQLSDGTQLWKVTHNGVDSHAIHFHLFHVQIVNRVGWDGAIRPPELNELGWKDTVRMNPLEDIVVALRPKVMTNLPFKVPNSHRLLDPSQALNAGLNFFNLNPQSGNASSVTNKNVNYGWEYVWHCHILGHEENDMMRAIAVAQPPEAPSNVAVTPSGAFTVSWTDNSVIANWFTIERDTVPTFNSPNHTVIQALEPECGSLVGDLTPQAGCNRSYTDATAPTNASVFYRVQANNTVGGGNNRLDSPGNILPATVTSLTPNFTGYDNVTASSAMSSGGAGIGSRILPVSPTALSFGSIQVNLASTPQVVTVTNTLATPWTVSNVQICSNNSNTATCNASAVGYTMTNGCAGAVLAQNANCTVTVTLTPNATGARNAFLKLTTIRVGTTTRSNVALTGTGVAPNLALACPSGCPNAGSNYSFGNVNGNVLATFTLSNSGATAAPFVIGGVSVAKTNGGNGTYANTGSTCVVGNTLAVGSTCTINVTFTSPAGNNTTTGTVTVTGTGVGVATPYTVTRNLTGA